MRSLAAQCASLKDVLAPVSAANDSCWTVHQTSEAHERQYNIPDWLQSLTATQT